MSSRAFLLKGSPFHDPRIAEELHDAGVTKAMFIEAPGGGAPGGSGGGAPTGKAKAKSKPATQPPVPLKPKTEPKPKEEPKPKKPKTEPANIADKMKQALLALGGGDGGA